MSITDFWKLLAESRLLSVEQIKRLAKDYEKEKPAGEPSVKAVAQWLLDLRAITKYQAQVLLAGKPGPFFYGDYKVYERIDKGRLAGWYRAVHQATKHCVLIRFATGPLLKEPQRWAAARENTLAVVPIVSPFVQRYFAAVDLQRFKFLVSEDIRGNSLEDSLTAGKLAPADACRLMRQVAVGLAAMHAAGKVHGDVRPANIVLETFGNQPPSAKLLIDTTEPPLPLDLTQLQAGSRVAVMADFLAPELLTAGRPPDPLSDVYALGASLYTLLAGKPPFAGDDVELKLKRQLSEPAQPLETMGVPQPLAQLVAYLMAKKPEQRYKSAAQAAEQLALFVSPAGMAQSPQPPPATLAAYEQSLQQKPTVETKPSPKPSATPASATPAPTTPAAPAAATVAPVVGDLATPTVSTSALPIEVNVTAKKKPSRTTSQVSVAPKNKQNRNLLITLAGAGLLVILVLVGGAVLYIQNRSGPQTSEQTGPNPPVIASGNVTPSGTEASSAPAVPSTTTEDNTSAAAKTNSKSTGNQIVIADDGKSLWASPTRGEAISLRCVPPGGQAFVIVRPAAMLANEEGRRVLTALGPDFTTQRAAWEKASGCKLEEIDQLHITLHNNDGKFPRTSFVVKTTQPLSKAELLGRWGNPTAAKEGNEGYYAGSTWAYYIPSAPEDEGRFAMGDVRDIKEVAAVAGAAALVVPPMERLRRLTDAERHFTLLVYPSFLFSNEGEALFTGERARLRQPLDWLLGHGVQAASLSAHIADEFYLEARLRPTLDQEPRAVSDELRDHLNKMPGSLKDYFVSLGAPPFWNKLADRYPAMMQELQKQSRIGVEYDLATLTAVLPAVAAHNLVLGGELLVATAPAPTAIASAGATGTAGPKTIAEALQLRTSYSIAQQSLEFAMRDIADDVKSILKNPPFEFAIKIIGDDLKLEGITRNQSIRDFKQENQTVADILTALVRKANPVTTVTAPSEKDQKLVWLIGPDPDNPSQQIVLITTRAAAGTKKYTLPPNFVEKAAEKGKK